MTLIRNVYVINVLIVICVTAVSSQETGKFWWLEKKKPDLGGVLDRIGESSGESDSDSENYVDYEETNKGLLPEASSARLTPVPQNGATSTPPSAQPGESKIVNTAARDSDVDDDDCVCVEYYLCNSNNTIITNGEGGIIDVRLGERCPGIQVCCRIPDVTPRTTVAPKPLACGERGGGFMSRILNYDDDNSTHFSEFPWMLALLKSEMRNGELLHNLFQCGASLIHPQAAITAAHCVSNRKESQLRIRAGEWDTSGNTEPVPYQERNVSQIIKHQGFYSGALYNDIALLVLDEPLQLVVNVLPVCLPEQDAVFDGRRCVATGWGRSAFGKTGRFQSTLKKVELPIVPSDTCQKTLRTTRLGPYFKLHESFVCAGGEPGRDTCNGDGGGPLACYDPTIKAYAQVGIVSWGIGCGDNGIPAVYTNVPRFRKWIDDTLLRVGLH